MLFWGQMEVLYAVGACLALHVAFLLCRVLLGALRTPDRATSVVYVKRPRQQLHIQRIHTPATVFEIRDLGNHCVDIDIRTHVINCELKAYWGVSIKDFPWNEQLPHEYDESHTIPEIGRRRLRLEVKDCELGDQPRTRYHLVTVITAPDADTALYSIYHLYGCSLKTSVLQQYLKSDGGRLLAVRTLFDEPRCVICMDQPATHTLLPCRHACVCHECFGHIEDRCPMCRMFVETFFVTTEPSCRNGGDGQQQNQHVEPSHHSHQNHPQHFVDERQLIEGNNNCRQR